MQLLNTLRKQKKKSTSENVQSAQILPEWCHNSLDYMLIKSFTEKKAFKEINFQKQEKKCIPCYNF